MTDGEKQKVIAIAGPTAAGKSKLAVALCQRYHGEVISADSMQVYRGMNIGTAKITETEMEGVPHHLIDILEPDEPWNVMLFKERASVLIRDIASRGKLPVICGGTGFYLHALLYDADFAEEEDHDEIRGALEQQLQAEGVQKLYERLKQVDPQAAERIHPHNAKRIIRALEYYEIHGTPISAHNQQMEEKPSPYDLTYIGLQMDRPMLYKRIDNRVDQMIEDGLVDEVRALLARGIQPGMTSMQGIGYKEMLPVIEEQMSLEEAVRLLKRDTRHFAKRQLTWFRGEADLVWIDALEDSDSQIQEIAELANFS